MIGKDDQLVRVKPMLDRIDDWAAYLSDGSNDDHEAIERHSRTGRPLGGNGFLERLKILTGRTLAPK